MKQSRVSSFLVQIQSKYIKYAAADRIFCRGLSVVWKKRVWGTDQRPNRLLKYDSASKASSHCAASFSA